MRTCARISFALALCVSMVAVVGCGQPSSVYVGVGVVGPYYGGGYPYYGGMGRWGGYYGRRYDEEDMPVESYPVCETPPLSPEG